MHKPKYDIEKRPAFLGRKKEKLQIFIHAGLPKGCYPPGIYADEAWKK